MCQPASLAVRNWRENERMKRKWTEYEEMERKWRKNEEMEICLLCSNRILLYFPLSGSVCSVYRRDISTFLNYLI